MSFPSIGSPYRTSSASTTYMHTCLLRATSAALDGGAQVMVFILSFAVFGASEKAVDFSELLGKIRAMRTGGTLIIVC
jgi:hypothetical protein